MLQGVPWPWRHGHAIGGALIMEAQACYRGSPGHGGTGML